MLVIFKLAGFLRTDALVSARCLQSVLYPCRNTTQKALQPAFVAMKVSASVRNEQVMLRLAGRY
jgi:hypothetical protein